MVPGLCWRMSRNNMLLPMVSHQNSSPRELLSRSRSRVSVARQILRQGTLCRVCCDPSLNWPYFPVPSPVSLTWCGGELQLPADCWLPAWLTATGTFELFSSLGTSTISFRFYAECFRTAPETAVLASFVSYLRAAEASVAIPFSAVWDLFLILCVPVSAASLLMSRAVSFLGSFIFLLFLLFL